MPTGYTADVGEGKVTEFRDFALRCARAMGALIMMRDEPLDAPIPDEFTPDQYYNKCLEEILAEIASLESASAAKVAELAAGDFKEQHDAWQRRWRERDETRARYEAMLAQVDAWEPPSEEHRNFKKFMREQLTESIRFDCSHEYSTEPQPVSPDFWKHNRLEQLHREAARSKQHQAEENERTESRNRWVAQLRESLRGLQPA